MGLRHTSEQVWFGSSCNDDDGLVDTPNCEQSQFDCNTIQNSCLDSIIDVFGDTLGDLPDMIENFMDYSEETCQNAFTVGQSSIILDVLENHRNGLLNNGKISSSKALIENKMVSVYPNPTKGYITIDFHDAECDRVEVFNDMGQCEIGRAHV